MTNIQFIICISSYILSLVAGLLLMIVGKKAGEVTFRRVLWLHLSLAGIFIIIILLNNYSGIVINSITYYSLAFFCSGVALSGLMLRSKMNVFIKIYFGIYALSFFLFVISPSTLFSIITKGKFKVENYSRFLITGNYYLDRQSSFLGNSHGETKYKIVQKLGYFNKTISRDVIFMNELDSIKTLSFIPNKLAILRGYYHKENLIDSLDVNADISVSLQKNEITTKSNNVK